MSSRNANLQAKKNIDQAVKNEVGPRATLRCAFELQMRAFSLFYTFYFVFKMGYDN